MKTSPAIPYDYATWRHCITVECGLALTPAFIEKRLAILTNPKEYETERFTELYGAAHLRSVLDWYRQAAGEASPSN